MYTWFCPPGGTILDPFAGGSVRGIVASCLGFEYVGIDLSEPQVEANRVQAEEICDGMKPEWHVGDARRMDLIVGDNQADFLFTCPPYGSLERYSDDERDLSTLEPKEFLEEYRGIIAKAAACLRPDRFAAIVVGDYRDKRGVYQNFPGNTVAAFQDAGMHLYNEAILVTAVGSLPIRAGIYWRSRKLGKTHQNILVFVKGDWKKAVAAICPPCAEGEETDQ
jgi:DNA modification methylase